jgi:hypothetical protein
VQGTARLWKEREVIFVQFAGALLSWLERLPVTQEVAGSSPVAPANSLTDRMCGPIEFVRRVGGREPRAWGDAPQKLLAVMANNCEQMYVAQGQAGPALILGGLHLPLAQDIRIPPWWILRFYGEDP